MSRPVGFAPYAPRDVGFANALVEIVAENRAYWPLTARQVFYRYVALTGSSKGNLADKVTDTLVRLRRAQVIPFGAIRDDGVSPLVEPTWTTPIQFLDGIDPDLFAIDPWAEQDATVRVMVEAAGMAPALHRAVSDLFVPVIGMGGFPSVTLLHDVAQELARRREAVILLVSDLDPEGLTMRERIHSDILGFLQGIDGVCENLKTVTVALNIDQTDGLPTSPDKPRKAENVRGAWTRFCASNGWPEDRVIQAEALPPAEIHRLVREAIEREVIDAPAWDEAKAKSEAGRETLQLALAKAREAAA